MKSLLEGRISMALKTFYSADFSVNDIFVWYPHIMC